MNKLFTLVLLAGLTTSMDNFSSQSSKQEKCIKKCIETRNGIMILSTITIYDAFNIIECMKKCKDKFKN